MRTCVCVCVLFSYLFLAGLMNCNHANLSVDIYFLALLALGWVSLQFFVDGDSISFIWARGWSMQFSGVPFLCVLCTHQRDHCISGMSFSAGKLLLCTFPLSYWIAHREMNFPLFFGNPLQVNADFSVNYIATVSQNHCPQRHSCCQ